MPSNSSTLGRPDLAVLLEDFDLEMDRRGFIGQRLMPRFDSAVVAANAEKIKLAQLLKNHDTARNADGSFKKADWDFEPWNFNCIENALEGRIDRQKAKIFSRYFDAEAVSTMMTQDAIIRAQEKRIAAKVFNTTTYATAVTTVAGEVTVAGNTIAAGIYKNAANAGVKWSVYATSTPIYDVLLAQLQVYAASGLWPDTVAMTKETFKHLKQNASIIDRIKYTKDPDTMTTADVAAAFDIENVLVAGGTKNSADEGATATPTGIWDKTKVWVGKVAKKLDNPWDPGIGRTFYFTGNADENSVETYYDNARDGDIVRVRHTTDENVMYSAAGFLLTAVL